MAEARIIVPDNIKSFLRVESCEDFAADRYFKTQEQVQIINEIIRKRRVSDEMLKMGVPLLNSTLLYGPTGTGKTTLCRYIAHKLNLDMAYINFATLIDGGVFGNTARNLTLIFEELIKTECVFVLDEIDCIAANRDSGEAQANGGELKRITLTLMQLLDLYEGQKVNSVIIGCTNRVSDLDAALKSRFKLKKEIGRWNLEERQAYINKFLKNVHSEYPIVVDQDNISDYCRHCSNLGARDTEADIKAGLARWIENGHKDFKIERIRDVDVS